MVDFTNILRAAFPSLSFYPKKLKPKLELHITFSYKQSRPASPKSAQKHAKARKSTQKHAKARKRITLFKFWNWTTVQMFGTTFPFFQLAVQKSVARFRGVGCVQRSCLVQFAAVKKPLMKLTLGLFIVLDFLKTTFSFL